MNRIDQKFAALRARREAALIPFLTLGAPNLGATRELMEAVSDSGADLLELGVPFSDPSSDGPVLQRASEMALEAGASLPRALEMVATFRARHQLPVVLYGYYNPIFHYGPERFVTDAKSAGVDGLLVVDLPPEEVRELETFSKPAGLHFIFLLAPTSDEDRMRKVLAHASGFLYYVSLTGVTGVKTVDPAAVRPMVANIRAHTDLPVGVGFGISTPTQAGAVAEFADAVVVGSAVMRLVHEYRGQTELVSQVANFVASLKAGVASAQRFT